MDHPSIMRAALASILCVFSAGSEAQPSAEIVTASISSSVERWDRPLQVVLRFQIAPHWHLYWSNPGDAGLAPAIRWKLPAGFRAGTPQFPTPRKIVTDGIVAFGYYDELILLTTLTPPPGYRPRGPDTIQADVEWLVCRETCRPGGITLALPCTKAGLTRTEALQAEARFAETAPVPWHGKKETHLSVTASRAGGGLFLRFESPVQADEFFPDLIDDAVTDHGSIHLNGRNVSLQVQPSGPGARIRRLRGILIDRGKGYSIDLPVHYQH
jgi:DsbC/DsbD-like thiol-disulfide interchange protein